MSLSLESLYRDHDNLRRILCLLEQLLIDICRGSFRSYPLLRCILAYIQDYPERIHHPSEDAILAIIFGKGIDDTKLRDNIRFLLKDHSEIETITRNVMAEVEPMLVSTHTSTQKIAALLSSLISRQRSHLLFEEMNIYPRIAEYADSTDWERITGQFSDNEDPLFGDQVSKEYEQVLTALHI